MATDALYTVERKFKRKKRNERKKCKSRSGLCSSSSSIVLITADVAIYRQSGSTRSPGSQPCPISRREALVTIASYTTDERTVSCVKSASGTHHANASERRARERKPPLGFRGIIEDDVSILDGGERRNEVAGSLGARVFQGRRGLARDIGSRGTDNLAGG